MQKKEKRNSSNRCYNCTSKDAGTPLVDVLSKRFSISRNEARRILDRRSVFVNQRRIWMARHKLSAGDKIEIHDHVRKPPPRDLQILAENDSYLVINKPAGILSNEANGSAEQMLQKQLNNNAIKAVHRLDKDTSGCLIMARHDDAFSEAVSCFRKHAIQKQYLCILFGKLSSPKKIKAPLEDKSASTQFTPLSWTDNMTLARAEIQTGRTHQIRKHAKLMGHSLLGDRQYGKKHIEQPAIRSVPRQMLHAWKLNCDELSIDATAPLPRDFLTAQKKFGLPRL